MDEIRYDERVSLVIPGGSPRQMTLAEAVVEALKAPPDAVTSCMLLREGNKPAIDGLQKIRAIRALSDFPDRPGLITGPTPMHLRSLYESSNGDRWFLGRRDGEAGIFIRHEPNAGSGGRPANFGLLEFMAQQRGPQHDAVLKLLSRLVADYLNDHDQPGG